ncbi:E5 protein [Bos taurus papillomavirus 11]|uniref:E5 protein n=1 Tax=Bos taurus papillomavirus 11 TaxID=714200 RepID=E1CGB7_9PAPI|nr:E5 protein [Bos taurus papillomavirus 11]
MQAHLECESLKFIGHKTNCCSQLGYKTVCKTADWRLAIASTDTVHRLRSRISRLVSVVINNHLCNKINLHLIRLYRFGCIYKAAGRGLVHEALASSTMSLWCIYLLLLFWCGFNFLALCFAIILYLLMISTITRLDGWD